MNSGKQEIRAQDAYKKRYQDKQNKEKEIKEDNNEEKIDIIGEMTKPMSDEELKKILGVNVLPKMFNGLLTYRQKNLDRVFIGYYRVILADQKSFKSVTKRIMMKSKGIEVPLLRSGKIKLDWEVDESILSDTVVFVISNEEEFFTTSVSENLKSIELGVFNKEEVIKYIEERRDTQ